MSISNSVRALLKLCGKRQSDLVTALNMTSVQSLNNKFYNERWSASDLAAVADACGAKLAFVLPDGVVLPISAADPAGVGVQAAGHTPPVGDMENPGRGRVTSSNTRKAEKPSK